MATDDSADLSANFYLAGHDYIFRSRIIHKCDETTMGSELTGFVQDMITETGNTTLESWSEVPYRGGFKVTICLSA